MMSEDRAAYMRQYRKARPTETKEHERRQSLRRKALRLLGDRHPEELAEIVRQLDVGEDKT